MILIENLSAIITFVFLLIIISYYFLLIIKRKKTPLEKSFSSITVIIPAHNEERYIKECIDSVLAADFNGEKEIIVVDDGSIDKTPEIISKYLEKGVKIMRNKHSGKSDSINTALKHASGELIAIVDADSSIQKNALIETVKEVGRKNVVAASGVIRVKNYKKFIGMWLNLEQLYNSLIRQILSKLNANIVTPGPLSVYRKKELMEIGGFSTAGFSEDINVTINLIRKGHRVSFAENAISETNMPCDIKGFLRQRTRFARGIIYIFKQHLRLNNTLIDLYTLPLFLFNYIQAVILGSFTIYQIVSGYMAYFVSKGVFLNIYVLKFFFEWFSIIGFIRWVFSVFIGQTPFTFAAAVGIISTFLSYPLYFWAIFKYSKKFDLWHIIPLFFMFPFWLLVMVIYIICLPEYFRRHQYNIWKKNE